jgi:MFS family permease
VSERDKSRSGPGELRLSFPQLGAITLVGIAGTINIGILPLLVGGFADALHLTAQQTGYLATSEYLGSGLGAALAPFWVARGHWRARVVILSIVALGLTLVSSITPRLPLLLAVRLGNGAALGSLYAWGVYCIGRSQEPDRFFGVFYTAQLLAYAITAYAVPPALGALGLWGLVGSTAAWLFGPLAFVWLIPIGFPRSRIAPAVTIAPVAASYRGIFAVAALSLLALSVNGVWAFVERLGSHEGIPQKMIALAVAESGLSGAAGGIAAAMLGIKLGRLAPSLMAVAAVIVGCALLSLAASGPEYALGLNLYSFGWLLAVPYFMGTVTAFDQSSRLTQLLPIVQLAAGVAAPTTAGWLAHRHGFEAVPRAAMVAVTLAAVILGCVLSPRRKSVP